MRLNSEESTEERDSLGQLICPFSALKKAIPEPLGAFGPMLASSQRRRDGTVPRRAVPPCSLQAESTRPQREFLALKSPLPLTKRMYPSSRTHKKPFSRGKWQM